MVFRPTARVAKRATIKKRFQDKKEQIYSQRKNSSARQEARKCIFKYLLCNPCADCGETDPVVLSFDHVRGHKRYEISKMRSLGMGWTTIKKEIDKCEVR